MGGLRFVIDIVKGCVDAIPNLVEAGYNSFKPYLAHMKCCYVLRIDRLIFFNLR